MWRRIITLSSFLLFILISPFGCEKDEPGEVPGRDGSLDQTGILSVWATDAPFPVNLIEKAKISVVKIELKQQEDTIFQNFSEDTVSVDLLSLRNGIMESLASDEVAAGSYDQMRLLIDHTSLLLKDGRTSVLKVPGGQQSGLKILFDPPIIIYPGRIANVLLDFNLSRSFILKGNPKSAVEIRGFNFKPVVRVAVIDSTGMIAGNVKDLSGAPLANAEVSVFGDSVIASTFSNTEGAYALLGIPGGTFSVKASLEGFQAQETGDIQISATEKTVVDFQLPYATSPIN